VLRAGSETTSLKLGTAAPGSVVQLLELVDLPDGSGCRRARTPQGWLTFEKLGKRNLQLATDDDTELSFSLAARLPQPEPGWEYETPVLLPMAMQCRWTPSSSSQVL